MSFGVAAFLLLGFAAVAVGLYVRPGATLQARAAALETALQVARGAGRERRSLQAEVEALGAESAAGARRLPGDARLDEFVSRTGALAQLHRVHLLELQPGEPGARDEVGVLPVRVTVRGDFERIYGWMVALESEARL